MAIDTRFKTEDLHLMSARCLQVTPEGVTSVRLTLPNGRYRVLDLREGACWVNFGIKDIRAWGARNYVGNKVSKAEMCRLAIYTNYKGILVFRNIARVNAVIESMNRRFERGKIYRMINYIFDKVTGHYDERPKNEYGNYKLAIKIVHFVLKVLSLGFYSYINNLPLESLSKSSISKDTLINEMIKEMAEGRVNEHIQWGRKSTRDVKQDLINFINDPEVGSRLEDYFLINSPGYDTEAMYTFEDDSGNVGNGVYMQAHVLEGLPSQVLPPIPARR